ncbi:MAG: hypothetical protein OZ921_02620 [Sorangiineae bacterium]|nr:hypothetical protein [Polyangiaceae bacterium]MEB2321380.1 hypothetical protein [Sorangiineae bacterium]
MKPLGAGSEIDAWCTKCRLDLGHRIIAMLGPKPARVVCMTCGSEHRFMAPRALLAKGSSAAKPTRVAAPRAAARPTQRALAELERVRGWEQRIAGKSPDAFARYSMDRTFATGQLLLHQKFGEGYVTSVLSAGKIDVMFRDGSRTLAHGQAP